MRLHTLLSGVAAALFCLPLASFAAGPVELTGKSLTLAEVEAVARQGAKVSLDKDAMNRVERRCRGRPSRRLCQPSRPRAPMAPIASSAV